MSLDSDINSIQQPVSSLFEDESTPVLDLSFNDDLSVFSETSVNCNAADIYIWDKQDANPSDVEHIPHFMMGTGGDVLQLNDLCSHYTDGEKLDHFLHFSVENGHTKIEIRPEGDQEGVKYYVVLDNVNIESFGESDNEIIHQLIRQGNLDLAGAL